MKIHEYQAKGILKKYGVAVPESLVADNLAEAVAHAKTLGEGVRVVKAQIHAGGRGKGGGVKICKTLEEVEEAAKAILGMQLITHQTGPAGQEVRKILIEKGSDIEREIYLGIVVDRATETPVMMASAEGGMDIEEIAANRPEAILVEPFDSKTGLEPYQGRRIAAFLGLPSENIASFASMACKLSKAFIGEDCEIAEINPLVRTHSGDLVALDAKMVFDDNAMFRHKDNLELRDEHEEDPMELRASRANLSYISMDGNIGCMVNGAGLAMATMDIIKHEGGEPANFLDVGGGATAERVAEAFRIILSDPKIEAILVNIFGGIVRCDLIADGVIAAAKEVDISVPVVVRLEGNRVKEGKKLLADSGMNIISADDLGDAACKVVVAAKEGVR